MHYALRNRLITKKTCQMIRLHIDKSKLWLKPNEIFDLL